MVGILDQLFGMQQPQGQDAGGLIQSILSQRFQPQQQSQPLPFQSVQQQPQQNDPMAFLQSISGATRPSFGDASTAALMTATTGGRYVDPSEVTAERLKPGMEMAKSVGELQQNNATMGGGATGALVQKYMDATGSSFPAALQAVQTGFRSNTMLDANGNIIPMPGALNTIADKKYAETTGGNQSDLQYKPRIAGDVAVASDTGKLQVKRTEEMPAAKGKMAAANQSQDLVNNAIDDAYAMADRGFSTGLPGAMAKNVPGTDAYNLQAKIGTIKSNIAFDKLGQLRAQSPTGGALGQVSNYEEQMLSNSLANLEQSQDVNHFKTNLLEVKRQYAESMANLRTVYKDTYGNTQGFDELFKNTPILPKVGQKGGPVTLQGASDSPALPEGITDADVEEYKRLKGIQ